MATNSETSREPLQAGEGKGATGSSLGTPATDSQLTLGYRATSDSDPRAFYEQVRAAGGAVWDESVAGWILTEYEDCSRVLQDEDTFNRADRHIAGGAEVRGAWRNLATLVGLEHQRLHNFMLKLINPRRCEDFRISTVRPLVADELDRLEDAGSGELWGGFTSVLPMRIGCTLLGVGDDAELIARIQALRAPITEWMDSLSQDPDVISRGANAIGEIRELFMPTILDRRTRPLGDLISEIWEQGPSIFPDWNEKDTFSACLSNYSGGETPYLLRNMIHGLLVDDELRRRVLSEPDVYLSRYAEECLRVVGAVHWQLRIATVDVELSSVKVSAGDRVFPIIAAANRDEKHFACPHSMNLEMKPPKDHLAFGRGPRYCPGVHLARVEAYEAVLGLFQRFPELHLDPTATQPKLSGWHVRSFKPLNVLIA